LSIGLGRDSIGTTVSIFPTECSLDDALPVLQGLKQKAVLTVFLQNVEFIHYFQRLKIPHVAITPDIMKYYPNCIYIDNKKLMQTIFQQLLACGHRKIAYLHNYNPLFFSRDLYEREKYFYQECVNNKLIIESDLIQYAGFTSKEYCCAIEKIIQSGFSFSAIIASDTYAADIYEELEKHQLKSGQDVAVVGIDDLESNEYLRPKLSSVRISRRQIANTAYEMLKYMLKTDSYALESRYITPEWIKRDSVPDLNTPE
jgi:DNA-binding LacI/PurR family transcriptional regulator